MLSKRGKQGIALLAVYAAAVSILVAQRRGPGGPPMRYHTVTSSSGALTLLPTTQQTTVQNEVSITVEGNSRVIVANGIPDHLTGPFPNRGNPHRIAPQNYRFRIPANPVPFRLTTQLELGDFGIAVNGIPFAPGAAEFYHGNRGGGWQYEPLSGAISLGLDAGYAHVQPFGEYHYHGLPQPLLKSLNVNKSSHSPIVGWAGDGFPIYAMYGYADPMDPNSGIKPLTSSYRLRSGNRPNGRDQPGGRYDGTFVADYEYAAGHGELDECNGRLTITPDFPEGTYAYFLTEAWPVIPRRFRGQPSAEFNRQTGPPGGPRGRRGPPPGRRPPPRR